MFHIGGEQELCNKSYFSEVTNSGRASLRLIIENTDLAGKHILVPNFLCEVILDVFKEYRITYSFYEVEETLNYRMPANLDEYDAVYFINYFGFKLPSLERSISLCSQLVIVDDVFSPYPSVLARSKAWCSFNSLRKIAPVADFSLVYINNPITKTEVRYLDDFSDKKYQAKNLKYYYLHDEKGDEGEYLKLFSSAETLLDENVGIFSPSSRSLIEAIEFYSEIESERLVRQKNYELAKSLLPVDITLDMVSDFYSYLPIIIDSRNEVRRKLMDSNIFLAIHWPSTYGVENKLSQRILSLPLDSRYSSEDIEQLCLQIKQALKQPRNYS
ncbi:hypothetical protein [Photobacterium indicum]|uniref:Pyridoxal phosphate-dependent transferase n=1 Tax=Photobacterium indicum TaxID=81447 RepID=A0A2T3L6E3_9GAMM|nr:hypothetical protein [Photobacterium indicum]PSV45697.1 hypothetical protein C9J47_16760 [Photobacterium indicum]